MQICLLHPTVGSQEIIVLKWSFKTCWLPHKFLFIIVKFSFQLARPYRGNQNWKEDPSPGFA